MSGYDWGPLVREQHRVLIAGVAEFVCTHQFQRQMDAAKKADDINNGHDGSWPARHFVATFTRKRSKEGYEVLVRIRPGISRSFLKMEYLDPEGSQMRERRQVSIPKYSAREFEEFHAELGGGRYATRAVNALARWKGIYSMQQLRELYEEMGDTEFGLALVDVRSVGEGTIQLIMEKLREESGE